MKEKRSKFKSCFLWPIFTYDLRGIAQNRFLEPKAADRPATSRSMSKEENFLGMIPSTYCTQVRRKEMTRSTEMNTEKVVIVWRGRQGGIIDRRWVKGRENERVRKGERRGWSKVLLKRPWMEVKLKGYETGGRCEEGRERKRCWEKARGDKKMGLGKNNGWCGREA